MMRSLAALVVCGALAVIVTVALASASASASASAAQARDAESAYVFGWPFIDTEALSPRGGTTEGPSVTPVEEPTDAFQRLQAQDLSPRERDRRAILALAGDYRVSFDFLEVMGFRAGFEPARPYRSWATERVYVLTNEPDHIVLQHILVMRVAGEDGEVQGPFVQKHWREEWRYEAGEAHVYRGEGLWERVARGPDERDGAWLQTVWQVDDAPRYAAWGEWRHDAERSVWRSGRTWRPLPQRERSVRDDYDALVGRNTVTILPTGWVHEQRNLKVRLADPGRIDERLAKEYGLARYERIEGYDFGAGDEYLAATEAFWATVRDVWDELLARHDRLRLRGSVDGERRFQPLFRRASAIAEGEDFSAEANTRFVREVLQPYLEDAGEPDR